MNKSSSPWLNSFASGEGKFQITNGSGIMVAARDLATYAAAGHGIFHELWRDHEWLFISKAESRDGLVEVEYLTLSEAKSDAEVENGHAKITEKRIVRNAIVFNEGDQVLITKAPMTRPKGSRLTVTTTYLQEELED